MKKENRFRVIFTDGTELKDEGKRLIIVDTETGVNYLVWKCGYAGSITPLLGADGNPIIIEYRDGINYDGDE